MDICCKLGEEFVSEKNVLFRSDNFFVVPALGQMGIEGYVLLCSQEHFCGIGMVPAQYETELEAVLERSRAVLLEQYHSEVLIFEHGPRLGCHKGGGCLEHAHLHVVPSAVDVMDFLNKKFVIEQIDSFERLREISYEKKFSYLFVEAQDQKRYCIEIDVPIASQYLRQIIASKRGVLQWDWRSYPDHATFEKTRQYLLGKF